MRRRRIAEHEAGHERWLLSYSDFITLLFAFFVVLFATTYRDKEAIRRLSRAIHNGFQSMGAFSQDEGGVHSVAVSLYEPADTPQHAQAAQLRLDEARAASAMDVTDLRRKLQAAMGKELEDHEMSMEVTPEGFVVSLKELGFFNSGQAELLPGAAEKIKKIAKILSRPELDLRVEGHSDDQPIHNAQFRSNWELSMGRAMAVLELIVDGAGFDPTHISASGYGQYRPVADNSTPEGRRMNRRVDIVVVERKDDLPHASAR